MPSGTYDRRKVGKPARSGPHGGVDRGRSSAIAGHNRRPGGAAKAKFHTAGRDQGEIATVIGPSQTLSFQLMIDRADNACIEQRS